MIRHLPIVAAFLIAAGFALAAPPPIQMPIMPGGYSYPVLRPDNTVAWAYEATSVSSAELVGSEVISVICTEACHIAIGADGVAATISSTLLPADTIAFFRVLSGSDTIAVISATDTPGGIVIVTEFR